MGAAPRFQGLRQFELCLEGGRMTQAGFDVDGDFAVDEPNDPAAVIAVQQALADVGYVIDVDGAYGPGTASVVRQFKIDQDLAVPPGMSQHDGVTGEGTSGRLDELFSQAAATVRLLNDYGEPLAAVVVSAEGVDVVREVTTDETGAAVVDLGGPWTLTLDPPSTLAAQGDLLDRAWPPDPQPEATVVTTLFTDVEVAVEPREDITVVVAARLQYTAELAAPLDGEVRVDGDGVRVTATETEVTVALQANGGFPATVFLDPTPPEVEPLALPDVVGWELPNGYVVREGDTAEGLGELFLHDPARFGELSDHDPVPGETILLPDEAAPGWMALATEPAPPEPQPEEWFQVTPDDIVRAFYTDQEKAAIHELLEAVDGPPTLDPHPAEVMTARAETLALVLASPEVLGPELEAPSDEVDG